METLEDIMTESKVVIENGKVKTIYSDEIERSGYMTIEECGRLLFDMVDKTEILLRRNAANGSK